MSSTTFNPDVCNKKLLCADDPKESALEEALDYLYQTFNAVEAAAEAEIEAWSHPKPVPGWYIHDICQHFLNQTRWCLSLLRAVCGASIFLLVAGWIIKWYNNDLSFHQIRVKSNNSFSFILYLSSNILWKMEVVMQ